MSSTPLEETPEEKVTYRKILWRVMPFVCLLYFVSFLDRAGIGYAGPNGMNEDLGLTAAAFGLASGIFFIGYVLFEVPSNIALNRFGAPRWIARIVITWGIIQALTAFVQSDFMLNVMRVLLGIAEAGFSPGILFYLTLWLPAGRRAMAFGIFLVMVAVSNIVGGPIAAGLIQFGDSVGGDFAGWRLMFLITGIIPFIFGIVTWFFLPEKPSAVKWLTQAQKDLVESDLAADRALAPAQSHKIGDALRDSRAWILSLAYVAFPYAGYVLIFFLPTTVSRFQATFGIKLSPVQVSLLVAIPSICGAVALLCIARSVSKHGRPGLHVLIATVVGAAGTILSIFADNPVFAIVALSIAAAGIFSPVPAVFSIVPKLFTAGAAATALALVNSVGSAGGFIGPYANGAIQDATGSDNLSFYLIAVILVAAGVTFFLVDRAGDRVRAARAESLRVSSEVGEEASVLVKPDTTAAPPH